MGVGSARVVKALPLPWLLDSRLVDLCVFARTQSFDKTLSLYIILPFYLPCSSAPQTGIGPRRFKVERSRVVIHNPRSSDSTVSMDLLTLQCTRRRLIWQSESSLENGAQKPTTSATCICSLNRGLLLEICFVNQLPRKAGNVTSADSNTSVVGS